MDLDAQEQCNRQEPAGSKVGEDGEGIGSDQAALGVAAEKQLRSVDCQRQASHEEQGDGWENLGDDPSQYA